jgi:hypothetical protein
VLATHPTLKRALVISGGGGLAVLGFIVLLELASKPWPFSHTSPTLVAIATGLLVISLFFRISGWQQLFHLKERPDRAACFTSAGAAAISSSVLPAKLDYVVKVWLQSRRRFSPSAPSPSSTRSCSCRPRPPAPSRSTVLQSASR